MSTNIAKPRGLRLNQKATLIPVAQFAAWRDLGIRTLGLTDLDCKVLDTIAAWYRRLYVEEFAGSLSYERMANKIGAEPRDVRSSISHLIELGLIGIERGSGARANHYLLALPKRLVAKCNL